MSKETDCQTLFFSMVTTVYLAEIPKYAKNLHFPRAVSLICDPWMSCIQKKVFFFTKKAISDHVYILCSSKLDSDLKIASDSVFLPSNWLKSQAICLTAYKTETKFSHSTTRYQRFSLLWLCACLIYFLLMLCNVLLKVKWVVLDFHFTVTKLRIPFFALHVSRSTANSSTSSPPPV